MALIQATQIVVRRSQFMGDFTTSLMGMRTFRDGAFALSAIRQNVSKRTTFEFSAIFVSMRA